MRNPPPPIPQDWGRATPRAKVVATAASIALPPAFSTSSPTSEAGGDSEAITPPRLLTASLYREPSAASVSPAGNIRISINVAVAKARHIVLLSFKPKHLATVTAPFREDGTLSLVNH